MIFKEKISKIIPVFAIFIVIIFAVTEIYSLASRTMVTQITREQTVLETVDAQMFIIKDEIILTNDSDGVTVPLAVNSERVSRGSTIAAVFSDETSAENYSNLQTLNQKLSSYKKIDGSLRLADVDLKKLNFEIDKAFYSILDSAYSSDFDNLSENKLNFSEKLSRKQISLNKNVDVTSQIVITESDIAAIKNNATPNKIITAETAGYYVNHLDGYENLLTTADLDSLTVDKLESALNSSPAPSAENSIGKIIDGYNWYTACIVNSADISNFKIGNTVKLIYDDSGENTVETKVYSVSAVGDNKSLIIFRCNLMNENLSGLRIVSGKIVLKEHTGLKVSRDAIRVNDKGEEGVFVRRGELITFRRINTVYSEDSFIIAAAPTVLQSDSDEKKKEKEEMIKNHIKLYDEIIVSGKDLSDGMVI